MQVAIIGYGFVGKALENGLKKPMTLLKQVIETINAI